MSGHQTATIEDTVYFWFAANDTSGSGGDGASPLFDVREAGAAAGAIPLLSGTPTLLSHANYPAGCHEIAVAATTGNGFAADDTFAVFCTIAIDSQNPTGFVGSCTLTPLAKASVATEARLAELDAGNLPTDIAAIPTTAMRGTDDAALASVATEGRLAELDAGNLPTDIAAIKSETALIVEDTGTTLPALLPVALVSGRMDSNVSAVADVAQSATNLEASTDTILIGTASGAPTTTTMVSDISITVDDQFKGRALIFASDTATAALQDQATDITACTASSNTLIFTALTTAPSSGDTFVIV